MTPPPDSGTDTDTTASTEPDASIETTNPGRKPAIEGWFTLDEQNPALLGSRCTVCATYVFPPATLGCPNPACVSETFETVELSRRGKIWSYTDARYQPPPPYVAADPYEPFCIAAVELETEKLVVLGQIQSPFTVDDLHVGMDVELVLDSLNAKDEDGSDLVIWKWRPDAHE
jgi:uncharacterized protein